MPEGCAGVLAIELRPGMPSTKSLRAIAGLVAAALMQLVYRSEAAYERTRLEATAPSAPNARDRDVSRGAVVSNRVMYQQVEQ
jgi:hypothetical protein